MSELITLWKEPLYNEKMEQIGFYYRVYKPDGTNVGSSNWELAKAKARSIYGEDIRIGLKRAIPTEYEKRTGRRS